jgi:hypothetical protein
LKFVLKNVNDKISNTSASHSSKYKVYRRPDARLSNLRGKEEMMTLMSEIGTYLQYETLARSVHPDQIYQHHQHHQHYQHHHYEPNLQDNQRIAARMSLFRYHQQQHAVSFMRQLFRYITYSQYK